MRIVEVSLLGSLLVESAKVESYCERRGSSSTNNTEIGRSPLKIVSALDSLTGCCKVGNVMSLDYEL